MFKCPKCSADELVLVVGRFCEETPEMRKISESLAALAARGQPASANGVAHEFAVPFEAEVPTLDSDAVPLPASRPPHAATPRSIKRTPAGRMPQP
jgi:hypothetical protein